MIGNAGTLKTGWMALLCLALLATACAKDSGSGGQSTSTATAPPPPAQQGSGNEAADEVELEYWRTVKDSDHSDDLWAYLEKYPNGAFTDLAKAKLERLMRDGGNKPEPGTGTAARPPAAAPPPAAPPATAPPPPTSVRRTREQIVKDAVRRALRRYSDQRTHAAPNIPRFKLDNVAQVHSLNSSRVLFLYDDGFSGGGKTGFCLTDRKVYWRFVSGSPAYYLDFEDIDQVRVKKKKLTINGYEVGTTMANDPARAAETFADLLEEIRDQLRRR
ncbi:MAG: hypothetical protein AAF657_16805 [Acidobacteriota bacterium]